MIRLPLTDRAGADSPFTAAEAAIQGALRLIRLLYSVAFSGCPVGRVVVTAWLLRPMPVMLEDRRISHSGRWRSSYAADLESVEKRQVRAVVDQAHGNQAQQNPPLVFISYAHEPDGGHHAEQVRMTWDLLREEGIDAKLDRPVSESPQQWAAWMSQNLEEAAFILVFASPAYKRRAEGTEDPGVGEGVAWEAALIRDYVYRHPTTWHRRILRIVLPGRSREELPGWLGGHTVTHYDVDPTTGMGMEALARYFFNRPYWTERDLGTPKPYPSRDTSLPASDKDPPGAVPSCYREQVRRIAAPDLVGREEDMADLAMFCTAPNAGPYGWWRAPAWSGKTALMAAFALRPLADVQFLAFFITSRYAGQNDRTAFTNALLAQLCELLKWDVPTFLTDTTREPYLLALLDSAASACRARGQELVLLVDGLDEDQSVFVGPDTHSIAALLPHPVPGGLRVLVTGRLNPPIPTDVPDHHPLRDPTIVRQLTVSPAAHAVRGDMERELMRFLRGSPLEQDLLGLVTAAGGGLSADDLAHLARSTAWEVAHHLRAASGRSFQSQVSQWRPGTSPDVYILGHEELQATAMQALGDQRLAAYRDRLHAWADEYQSAQWPPGTPEYLLRGYFRMLATTGGHQRMVQMALDAARHERMLHLSGGDSDALAEIVTAQEVLSTNPEPDLLSLGRLARHRDRLHQRNSSVPGGLAYVWASLGDVPRGEHLARTVTYPAEQAASLAEVSSVVAATDPARAERLALDAERIARTIAPPNQEWGLLLTARAMAPSNPERAERMAFEINESLKRDFTNPREEVPALVSLVAAVLAVTVRDPRRRERLAHTAERIARTLDAYYDYEPHEKARVMLLVARTLVVTDPERAEQLALDAERLAGTITNPSRKAKVMARVARTLVVTDPERAEQLALESERLAGTITNPSQKTKVIALVARTLVVTDPERAEQLALESERLARKITHPYTQGEALAAVAQAVAATDPDRAERLARKITHPYTQGEALAAVAQAVAATDPDHANHLIRTIADPSRQAHARAAVARTVAATDPDRAEHLARTITGDIGHQARTLAEVAGEMAATRPERAKSLAAEAEQLAHAAGGSQNQPLDPLKTHRTDPLRTEARALAEVARALANSDPERTEQLALEAERLARTMADRDWQAQTLADVALAMADTDPERAERLALDAYRLTEYVIDDRGRRAPATIGVARAMASSDPERAERLAREPTDPYLLAVVTADVAEALASSDPERAERLAQTITNPIWHAQAQEALKNVVRAMARSDPERAERLAQTITDPNWRAQALADVAQAWGGTRGCAPLARAFRDGSWTTPLQALAGVDQAALLTLADDLLRTVPS
ncbi:hypothetical protein [Streptomyces sp. NPDC006739]|uniref:hypothetical protein n=1 Tax=Streptomyces sp. NPDC006739 TaxID=3364763 RepID=UPI003699F2AA